MIGDAVVTRSLVGPRVVGGTWSASGTWTIPAVTLGGDISMNGKYLDCGAGYFQVKTTQAGGLAVFRAITDSAQGAFMQLRHETTSPAVSDYQSINFNSTDGDAAVKEHGHFRCQMTNVTSGAETAQFLFGLASAGAAVATKATLSGAGLLTLVGGLTVGASSAVGTAGTGANGMVLTNPKNAAASALSGTQLDVEIDIGGTPYHFTVYPTKA